MPAVQHLDGEYALMKDRFRRMRSRATRRSGVVALNISQMLCGNERWRCPEHARGARRSRPRERPGRGMALVLRSATLLYVVPLVFCSGALIGAAFAERRAIAGAWQASPSPAVSRRARQIRQRHDDPRFQPHVGLSCRKTRCSDRYSAYQEANRPMKNVLSIFAACFDGLA